MNITANDPPRAFTVGRDGTTRLLDCARIALEPDEQVTFTTPRGGEHDVRAQGTGGFTPPPP